MQKQMHVTGTVQKNQKGLLDELKCLHLKNQEMKVYRNLTNMFMTLS